MLRFGKLWINLILNPLITIWDPFECIEQIYYTDMEIWLNWKFFLNPNYLLIFTWKIQTYTKYLLLDPKYLFNLGLICISKESTFIMSFDVVSEFRDTTQKTVLVISIGLNTHFSIEWWHFIQSSQWFFHFSVANESTRTLKFWC